MCLLSVVRCLFGLILCVALHSAQADEADFDRRFAVLQEGWQQAYYLAPKGEKADRLAVLLEQAQLLRHDYPLKAEARILEAIVLCVSSDVSWGLSSLSNVAQARDLLLQAKDMDPKAMDGSALITLGALYYQVPGWPFSFGDDDMAEVYLKQALRFYPDALDTNYFFGDFLYRKGKYKKAYRYLLHAQEAPIRASLAISDRQLKKDLVVLLKEVREEME